MPNASCGELMDCCGRRIDALVILSGRDQGEMDVVFCVAEGTREGFDDAL